MAAAGLPSPTLSKSYVTGLMQATASEIRALAERSDLAAVAAQVGPDSVKSESLSQIPQTLIE